MTHYYDKTTDTHVVTHDIYPITVKHKSASEAIAMLAVLARRYEAVIVLREPKSEDML